MINLELPLGKRSKGYRFWEIVPAVLSYGMIILLIVLSFINPFIASIYLLLIIITLIVRAVGIAYHTIQGHRRLVKAQRIDWHRRLHELEDPEKSYAAIEHGKSTGFGYRAHKDRLRLIAADPEHYPKPSQLYHMVIIAAYNEDYEVLQPTVESVKATSTDNDHIILVLAYEERGGADIAETMHRLKREYKGVFHAIELVMHPNDLPDEVVGKGPNITYAAQQMTKWCDDRGLEYQNVMITTLDSDNRPHSSYFDYVAYEYIGRENRKHLSYQPIALYFGNIWDVPAPMRIIATANSFWTIICSMRPHVLRNFASHSQPMDALAEMDFWSKRSIVEDGHQFWRSYFYFNGDYAVTPIHVPIYQDAVMANTYLQTLKAQFVQLRRWAYGASDIPFVATRLFSRARNIPLFQGLADFFKLIDSHVSLAAMAFIVAFGGWAPLLLNAEASRNYSAHLLPEVVSYIQRIAMIGIFITILLSLKLMPPPKQNPGRKSRFKWFIMIIQWVLIPVVAICYNAMAAFNAQTRLALGKYLDKFDVTVKATAASRDRAKQQRLREKDARASSKS